MRNTTKSGPFLIEMIIAIAFFALAGAMCTSLFVSVSLMSKQTRDANMAVFRAQNVAECFKAAQGDPEESAKLLNAASPSPDGFSLYYDGDWFSTDSDYKYRVDVSIGGQGAVRSVIVDVISMNSDGSGNSLYRLEAKKYVPSE